jgi:hypothetical protein
VQNAWSLTDSSGNTYIDPLERSIDRTYLGQPQILIPIRFIIWGVCLIIKGVLFTFLKGAG